MKVALVHYWLVTIRGGEKVLQSLAEMFPDADIYAHVIDRDSVAGEFGNHKLIETFIGKLPFAKKNYQSYLPLMPMALEQIDFRDYDLVISSESGPAKGIVVPPHIPHICYCHTPMRYLWDMYGEYRENAGIVAKAMMPLLCHWLRVWDYCSSARVDHFVSNSQFVARRINKYYRRDATVIHPPVAIDDFYISDSVKDYYLILGQLVPYKRTDIAIEAFSKMGKKLVVVGEGPEMKNLQKIAGSNIKFLGRQPFSEIRNLYANCSALIFPGVEDFGIVPLEAMASGRPVIAFGEGGALETVVDGVTGIFFQSQHCDALIDAVEKFESSISQFDPVVVREHAKLFSPAVFKRKMTEFIRLNVGIQI